MLTHQQVRAIVRNISGIKDYGFMDKTGVDSYNIGFGKAGGWDPLLVNSIRAALRAAGYTGAVKTTGLSTTGNGYYLRLYHLGV